MDKSGMLTCRTCGLPNIIERSVCKRCRAPLRPRKTASVPSRPYTNTTGELYMADNQLLAIYPHLLMYEAGHYLYEVPWHMTKRIRREWNGQYMLLLDYGPHLATVTHPVEGYLTARRIPLSPFGYPQNTALRDGLFRFAQHLYRQ